MIAKKIDKTHGPIRDHLRALGYRVLDLGRLGRDAPDLAVGSFRTARVCLVECKTGNAKLRKGQARFFEDWARMTFLARTPEDAEIQVREAIGEP